MARRCCSDYANVCSQAAQLQLAAQTRDRTRRIELPVGTKLPTCWRKAMANKPIDVVEGSYDASDLVTLRSRRSRKKIDSKCQCDCRSGDVPKHYIDRADHEDNCNRTLIWVVRVSYTTENDKKAHADSIRLCMADAARLCYEYVAQKAKIIRVYPLYK